MQAIRPPILIDIVNIFIMNNYENPMEMVRKNIGNKLYIRLRNKTEI